MQVSVRSGAGVSPSQVKRWYIYREWEAGQRIQGEVVVTSASIHPDTGQICSLHILFDNGTRWKPQFPLRTPTVDVLTSIEDGRGKEYFLFVEQFREAVGMDVISNPAGGIDEGETPEQAVLRELREEIGMPQLKPRQLSLLVNVPVLASPGGINEVVSLYRAVARVAPNELPEITKRFHGGTTGLVEEGEELKGYAISRSDLPKFKSRINDAKTLLSLERAGL